MRRLTEIFLTLKARYNATLENTKAHKSLAPVANGYLEKIGTIEGRMIVEGWYKGPRIEIMSQGIKTPVSRTIQRDDVIKSEKTGFRVSIAPTTKIIIQTETGAVSTSFGLFSKQAKARAIGKTLLFLPMLFFKNPLTVARFLLFNDRKAAAILENLLLQKPNSLQREKFDMVIFAQGSSPTEKQKEPVAIILPVYNSFDLLKECLTRILAHTTHPYRLFIIEDCSSDHRIKPWLRHWTKENPARITLLENPKNLGFIGSVNRGIAAAKGQHIVLINSDALVPQGWLTRLMAPIYANTKIASTTPLSNNAEILSVPVLCKENPLAEGAVDRIDAIAKSLNGRAPCIEIPTGVGFCMALNKRYLARVPSLDMRFGKGYGEEVDWCQKTRAIGGKHLAVTNLYVHHVGGQSFGIEKQKRLAKNNAVITRLYPRFDQLVQDFSANDPLHSTRIALGVATLDIGQPVPIYLSHSLGGGTEKYLQNRIQTDLETGQGSIIIRDGCQNNMLDFELYTPVGKISVLVKNFSEITRLLAPLRQRALVYSCLVGAHSPIASMRGFLENLASEKDSFSVQLHDFFPVCPSYNLLDMTEKYCNVPNPSACETCYQSIARSADTSQPDINSWRESWSEFLGKADSVEAFSENSAEIFAKAYPDFKGKLRVKPHTLPARPNRISASKHRRPVVGILGNIGHNKGAGILQKAADLAGADAGRLIVFGNLDPKYAHKNIAVTGTYTLKDLPRLARANKINCWLIPSIWPETFSFTTHEALATGLPVFGFDIGAQAEALRHAENGFVIDDAPSQLFANIENCLKQYSDFQEAV